MTKNRRKKMKEELQRRQKQSYDSREGQKSNFRTFFDDEKMEGVNKWRPGKAGDYFVDIIPYEVGPNDPGVAEGRIGYALDIAVHRNVGPTNEQIVCPSQYGKPCPICEEIDRRFNDDEDYESRIKPLRTSRRCVYNVIVRDGAKEEEKGVQVMEMSHYIFEKAINDAAKNKRTGELVSVSDPDFGKTVSFTKTGSGKSTRYSSVALEERVNADGPYTISDEELDAAYTLDNLIKILDYDEIAELFNATGGSGDESNKSDEPDESADVPTESDKSGSDTKKSKSKKSGKSKKGGKCPVDDGVFGSDFQEYDECDDCELFKKCKKAFKKMSK